MSRILITGGTGIIGRALTEKLLSNGHSVAHLSRSKLAGAETRMFHWDPAQGEIDPEAIVFADHIIHLAGANIGAKRWSKTWKIEIIDSRVKSAELILGELKNQGKALKSFISSSATGYYGSITSEQIFTEADPPGKDFLGEICRRWETAADNFQSPGTRIVKIRTGVVLTASGGALAKLVQPVKLGIGSPLGSGKQFMPWIHIDDLCEIYAKAIEDNSMSGAYNGVAPMHADNREFTRAVAAVLKKPFWFPNVPAFILKILFGSMATIILDGSRISAGKIIKSGFTFKYENLEDALSDLIR